MLFRTCRNYLVTKLKEAGLKTKPFTSEKKLLASQESHVGAVLPVWETPTRNGSKTIYRDEEGARKKRRKVFDRPIAFSVIIGEYDEDAVEAIYEQLLAHLDDGITVDGNYVPIRILDKVEWDFDADEILAAKVAVEVIITFEGGVYRDTGFARLGAVEIETIEKTNGEEPIHGDE